ncbi:transporter [Capnocytophaga genosp. AHN8471]|uniref:Transporter n=1 Tax=Capnocytophaga genosp. AHN8471 TaxID=327574 RepID=A0ABS1YS04_9FLAO|nr:MULTISPECIES: transporter [Capnocytophaga]MBM0649164.1 transporter [Capnocytophaga genosp. AHN8471]MBM0661490.1 transporter [Capnocytophaga genosp. AHN8471]
MLKLLQFIKNWTLPLSMGIGAVAYLVFYYVPALEGASQWLAPIFDAILPLFMFLILYVTFCKVDFKRLALVPWHWWMIAVQCVLVGSITGAILFFGIHGKELILLESVLACIISPCAAAAAVVTLKLGGNLEQMTTYTFVSNLLCALLIPVCFPLIEPASQMTFWSAFSLIMQKVCLVLVVPMLLALLTKTLPLLHRFHQWLIHIPDLSFYLWGCSLMIVTGTTLKNIFHAETSVLFLLLIGFLGLALCLLQYAIGWRIGNFFNSSIEAGQALGQKNTAFAIWIAATYLHPLSTVGPGCYILWQNIINSIEIWKKGKYNA